MITRYNQTGPKKTTERVFNEIYSVCYIIDYEMYKSMNTRPVLLPMHVQTVDFMDWAYHLKALLRRDMRNMMYMSPLMEY